MVGFSLCLIISASCPTDHHNNMPCGMGVRLDPKYVDVIRVGERAPAFGSSFLIRRSHISTKAVRE